MKKLKLIYNPFSGQGTFPDYIDECITIFQKKDYEVHLFRSSEKGDIKKHIGMMEKDYYDAIVVSGGDGTINIVVNALINNKHDIPLGIIPSGTANDFATFINLPKDILKACEVIARGRTIYSDIGKANEKYFINVCGAGLLTNISQNIDSNLKTSLGKLAYYIKGIGELPNFVPLDIEITNSKEVIRQSIYFFIVLNTAGTGGFVNLAPHASISDGKFDFIAFKAMPIVELAVLFVKVLKGDFLNDSNIIHFQDSYIKIKPLFEHKKYLETDLDGEAGQDLPVEIKNLSKKMRIFI